MINSVGHVTFRHQLIDLSEGEVGRTMKTKIVIAILFSFVMHFGGLSRSTLAQSTFSHKFDTSRVLWKTLSFKCENFWGAAISKVKLDVLHSANVEKLLTTNPEGRALMPTGPQVLTVSVNSTIDPFIGPDDYSETKVWFTPQEATALQRIRVRLGKKKWQKVYRWTDNGVYRLRKKPNGSDEENLPMERWTNKEESFYPYDLEKSRCLYVSEPSVLLFFVSAASLSLGDEPSTLCIFNKKQLHRVQIQVEKLQRLKVNYIEKLPQSETLKDGEIDVLKISFKPHSLFADEAKAEPFSFLGLKGDFDIFVDKVSRIPVQVSGRIPKFGRVDIKLEKAQISPGKK